MGTFLCEKLKTSTSDYKDMTYLFTFYWSCICQNKKLDSEIKSFHLLLKPASCEINRYTINQSVLW